MAPGGRDLELAAMTDTLHSSVARRLEGVDQRYTAGRRELVEVLASAGRPLSIPEIREGRRELPQSSIYRNLAALEAAGAVHRVTGSDEFARYELAEELTGHHHHHLVCVRCRTITDFEVPDRYERTLARAFGEVADSTGFRPASHRLDLFGLCADCA